MPNSCCSAFANARSIPARWTQALLACSGAAAVCACDDGASVQGSAIVVARGAGNDPAVAQSDAAAAKDAGAAPAGLAPSLWSGCQGLATTYCAKLATCLPHDMQIDYAEPAVCVQREALRCSLGFVAAGASTALTALAGCQHQIGTQSCDFIDYGGPPRCWFEAGQLKGGAACAFDNQCIGKFCQKSGNSPCGVCANESALGAKCAPNQCAAGLACVFDGAQKSFRCSTKLAVGGACTPGAKYESLCGYGLVCAAGQCVAASGLGHDCKTVGCNHDQGLDCHKQTGKCVAIPMSTAGSGCSQSGIGSDHDRECFDGRCLNRNDRGNGTCKAYAVDGGKCESWTGSACRVPAVCQGGSCVLPGSAKCK